MTGIPTFQEVADVVERLIGDRPVRIERFSTGLAHFVHEVWFEDGSSLVARMTRSESVAEFKAAIYWQQQLATVNVPFARILVSDLEFTWPTLLLERLPGTDLQHVYNDLSIEQRSAIASEIAAVQQRVPVLPIASGYGYALSYDDPDLLPTWTDLLIDQMDQSRRRMRSAGIVDDRICDDVDQAIEINLDRLNVIPATPFLDDTTTKNVIIDEGMLSGIVDLDCVCFGDPLFAVALTWMAILSRHWPDDYVESWFEAAGCGENERWRLDLYTAVHACGFLSELGQSYNKSAPEPVDPRQVEHLRNLAARFLRDSGGQ